MATEFAPTIIHFLPGQKEWLEDQALANKRAKDKDLDSISKIVRQAVNEYRQKEGDR
jgi:acid phosphatase class B